MNTNPSGKPPVALIAGPTASGKSALAMALAQATGGTIINADASQVYADLHILSARPSPEDEERVPHRLFGTIDGAEPCSAARWAADAASIIRAVHAVGRLPILVGGTGLYIRTLLDGIAPVPPIDPLVRDKVRSLPVAEVHAALVREDPEAAGRLGSGDTARVARALEVVRSTGRTLASWQAERAGGIGGTVRLCAAVLTADRAWLDARINERTRAMLEGGALAEVANLLARNLDPTLPVLRAIGVAELTAVLAGRTRIEDAEASIALATRRYAKRQATWFRHQPPDWWERINAQESERNIDRTATFLRSALDPVPDGR